MKPTKHNIKELINDLSAILRKYGYEVIETKEKKKTDILKRKIIEIDAKQDTEKWINNLDKNKIK